MKEVFVGLGIVGAFFAVFFINSIDLRSPLQREGEHAASASAAFGKGNYAEAEKQWLAAVAQGELKVTSRSGEPGSGDCSVIGENVLNLAELYRIQGRLTEAESFARKCLATCDSSFPGPGPSSALHMTAMAEHKLALVYTAQGKVFDAASSYERALAIEERYNSSDDGVQKGRTPVYFGETAKILFDYSAFLRKIVATKKDWPKRDEAKARSMEERAGLLLARQQ